MPKKGFRKKFEKHRKTKNFFAKIRAEIQRQKTGKKQAKKSAILKPKNYVTL